MSFAETWTAERNLNLSSENEVLIYLLGRLEKGALPEELLVLLASHLREKEEDELEN